MSQQDWALMQRIAAGDEEAVPELYDRFSSLVYKSAYQVLGNKAEADDAVQEIFVRLWRTADRYDPRRAKLVTWVMLIARRHLIDRLRRGASKPTPATLESEWAKSIPKSQPEPDRPALEDERNAFLRKKIADLPELQRVVIERSYLQGYTLREVSQQLDAPLGTVKSALSRGLMRLRERIKSDQAIL